MRDACIRVETDYFGVFDRIEDFAWKHCFEHFGAAIQNSPRRCAITSISGVKRHHDPNQMLMDWCKKKPQAPASAPATKVLPFFLQSPPFFIAPSDGFGSVLSAECQRLHGKTSANVVKSVNCSVPVKDCPSNASGADSDS